MILGRGAGVLPIAWSPKYPTKKQINWNIFTIKRLLIYFTCKIYEFPKHLK